MTDSADYAIPVTLYEAELVLETLGRSGVIGPEAFLRRLQKIVCHYKLEMAERRRSEQKAKEEENAGCSGCGELRTSSAQMCGPDCIIGVCFYDLPCPGCGVCR